MKQYNVNDLKPHPRNNEFFDDTTGEAWAAFLSSVKTSGIIEPIVITPDKMIVSGHQRVRACKELGIEMIPCEIREYIDEEDIFFNMLSSNASRLKNIPSIIKRIKIINEMSTIIDKRNKILKAAKKKASNMLRNEIKDNRELLLNYFNNQCSICGMNFKETLVIHHVVPITENGDNSIENLSCLCPNCHALIHKFLTYFNNEQETELNRMTEWLSQNYTKAAYDNFFSMYYDYLKHRGRCA